MISISLPLCISGGRISLQSDIKTSIDSNVSVLVSATRRSCVADPNYGFVFNNFRFNIFNENEGVIFDSKPQVSLDYERNAYNLKLSGKSQNINTFAAELCKVISLYEPRLNNVKSSMTYIRNQRLVFIIIKGVIAETGEEYMFSTNVKAWN